MTAYRITAPAHDEPEPEYTLTHQASPRGAMFWLTPDVARSKGVLLDTSFLDLTFRHQIVGSIMVIVRVRRRRNLLRRCCRRSPCNAPPREARENVGVVVARGRMLSPVRPLMRQEHSRRPVWEFADWVQITRSVLEAQWKALVVPAPSHRLLRHTLLPLTLTSSRSWSAYAATAGVL